MLGLVFGPNHYPSKALEFCLFTTIVEKAFYSHAEFTFSCWVVGCVELVHPHIWKLYDYSEHISIISSVGQSTAESFHHQGIVSICWQAYLARCVTAI